MSEIVPHYDLPFRFESGGKPAYVEQDSLEEVTNSVEVVLRYQPGDRPDSPDFGTPDQRFSQGGADAEEVERAVEEWEPRAVTVVEAELDPIDTALARVGVEVMNDG